MSGSLEGLPGVQDAAPVLVGHCLGGRSVDSLLEVVLLSSSLPLLTGRSEATEVSILGHRDWLKVGDRRRFQREAGLCRWRWSSARARPLLRALPSAGFLCGFDLASQVGRWGALKVLPKGKKAEVPRGLDEELHLAVGQEEARRKTGHHLCLCGLHLFDEFEPFALSL